MSCCFSRLRAPVGEKMGGTPRGDMIVQYHSRLWGADSPSRRGRVRECRGRKIPEIPFTPNRNPYTVFGTGQATPMTKSEEPQVPGKNPAAGDETSGLREDSPPDGLSGIPFIEHWSRRPAREDGYAPKRDPASETRAAAGRRPSGRTSKPSSDSAAQDGIFSPRKAM